MQIGTKCFQLTLEQISELAKTLRGFQSKKFVEYADELEGIVAATQEKNETLVTLKEDKLIQAINSDNRLSTIITLIKLFGSWGIEFSPLPEN